MFNVSSYTEVGTPNLYRETVHGCKPDVGGERHAPHPSNLGHPSMTAVEVFMSNAG